MSENKQGEAEATDRESTPPDRRKFLTVGSGAMVAGLAAGYGALGLVAGRYLYPARPEEMGWVFVAEERELGVGDSLLFRGPSGETVNVTRQGDSGEVSDFIALSSTCPHLGCQVHWEPQNDRYFCPCHNGVFDAGGKGTEGPPGDAGQSLPRYALKIDKGLLFIEVPTGSLAEETRDAGGEVIKTAQRSRPGHDPCLADLTTRDTDRRS